MSIGYKGAGLFKNQLPLFRPLTNLEPERPPPRSVDRLREKQGEKERDKRLGGEGGRKGGKPVLSIEYRRNFMVVR